MGVRTMREAGWMPEKTTEEKAREARRDLECLHTSLGGFVEALCKFCEAEKALSGLAESRKARGEVEGHA